MKENIKTKIVCTIGPSSWDRSVLKKLIDAGMTVARINASFADAEEIKRVTHEIRSVSRDVAVMLDLKGHKIRISDFAEPIQVQKGDRVTINCMPDDRHIYVSYPNLYRDVNIGSKILIDDGKVHLEVEKIEGTLIHTVALNNGVIKRLKTVNVPGSYLHFDTLTDKDKNDIKAGIESNVDFIAGSFIRDLRDVNAIKERLEGTNIEVIAKIEDPLGVSNFDEILQNVYGIMIARGDLGVEIPYQKVPILQKEFIAKCKSLGKPVIVATHMLESMVSNPAPTRAEVNDVANAVFDRADAIMTSAETSTGMYPIEAVEVMNRISNEVEMYMEVNSLYEDDVSLICKSNCKEDESSVSRALAISKAAYQATLDLKVDCIIVFTKTGFSARMLSRYDLKVPIYAFTPNESVSKKLLLSRGVYPYHIQDLPNSRDEAIKYVLEYAKKNRIVGKNKYILIVIGSKLFQGSPVSTLEIQKID